MWKKQSLHMQVLLLSHMTSPNHHSNRSHLPFNGAKKTLLEECITKCTWAENHDSIEDRDFEYYKKPLLTGLFSPCSPRKEFMELNLAKDTSLVCFYSFFLSILLYMVYEVWSEEFLKNFTLLKKIFLFTLSTCTDSMECCDRSCIKQTNIILSFRAEWISGWDE